MIRKEHLYIRRTGKHRLSNSEAGKMQEFPLNKGVSAFWMASTSGFELLTSRFPEKDIWLDERSNDLSHKKQNG